MPRVLSVIAAIWAFTFSQNIQAQDTLDRVDPARVEERKLDVLQPPLEAPPTLENEKAEVLPADGAVAVGAIELVGLDHLPRSQFSDIIEPYLGRTLTHHDLAALADRLAERAQATYPLASAAIEPQTMRAGILRVRIDEGKIDAVELEGFQNDALLTSLRQLITGAPVRANELETRLLIAGDIDGVTIEKTRVILENGRRILKMRGSYRSFEHRYR